jgi:hypothetical protein
VEWLSYYNICLLQALTRFIRDDERGSILNDRIIPGDWPDSSKSRAVTYLMTWPPLETDSRIPSEKFLLLTGRSYVHHAAIITLFFQNSDQPETIWALLVSTPILETALGSIHLAISSQKIPRMPKTITMLRKRGYISNGDGSPALSDERRETTPVQSEIPTTLHVPVRGRSPLKRIAKFFETILHGLILLARLPLRFFTGVVDELGFEHFLNSPAGRRCR